MERNIFEEIDVLQRQMQEVQEALEAMREEIAEARGEFEELTMTQGIRSAPSADSTPGQGMFAVPTAGSAPGQKTGSNQQGRIRFKPVRVPEPALGRVVQRLSAAIERDNLVGAITYAGIFSSEGNQSSWLQLEMNIGLLLALIESRAAEKVLQCIGNHDRLNLLLALLKQPMSVAELVEQHSYSSTGQVYHLLKPLLAADILYEAERGVYGVRGHRVRGIIMLLAGIADILDPEYSQGSWESVTMP